MSDQNPPREETAEEKARREELAELFSDIEDVTPEDELTILRKENARLTASLATAQSETAAKQTLAQETQQALTRAEAKFENDKKFAVEKFVKDMLPVIDTLELGLKAIPAADRAADVKYEKLAAGLEKTLVQLTGVFNKHGIREINPIGEAFDENKHEALAVMPQADKEPGTVIDVQQKGYEIADRLIRAAKVVVTPAG